MSEGFVHSIKVPRLYKTAANIIKQVTEDAASLKQLIYFQKHPNVKGLYALTATTLQHASQLEEIIRNTQILAKETRLEPWLTRILISELIWGKQSLQSKAKPILTVQSYENQLREELKKINKTLTDLFTKKKVEKPRFVRINTLIITVHEAIQEFKADGYIQLPKAKNYETFLESLKNLGTWEFIQDFHIPELIAFAPGTKFYNHEGYHSGAILLQDKASCLPAFLLNPTPGSVVLDTCAAPGMKTTHLAAILRNEGQIYAIEKSDRRYETLCNFVESTKAHIVKIFHENASNLDSSHLPDVEYILVDPSCSGSGMDRPEFDKNNQQCDPIRLKSLQSFQVFILRHALLNFPKAKKLVYSTCSIYPEENEMVIDEILTNIGHSWKLVPARKLLHNDWINYSSTEFNCKDNCLYAKPDEDLTSGFFVAIFERNFDIPLPKYTRNKIMFESEQEQKKNDEHSNEQLDQYKKKHKHSIKEKVKKLNENKECDENFTHKKKKKKKNNIEGEQQIAERVGKVEKLETIEKKEDSDENNSEKKKSKKKKKKKRKHSINDTDETEKQQSVKVTPDLEEINVEVAEANQNIKNQNDDPSKKKKKVQNE